MTEAIRRLRHVMLMFGLGFGFAAQSAICASPHIRVSPAAEGSFCRHRNHFRTIDRSIKRSSEGGHCCISLKLMASQVDRPTKEQAASSNDNDPFICILRFAVLLMEALSLSFNQNQHKTCERGKRILRFTRKT